jgi:hypothetical protein
MSAMLKLISTIPNALPPTLACHKKDLSGRINPGVPLEQQPSLVTTRVETPSSDFFILFF